MAKLFLDNDTITLTEKLTVFGSTGTNDKVIVNNSALASTINSNVETIQFAGKFSDYQYAIQGNQLLVSYQGQTLATIGIQTDSNGTALAFSDTTTTAQLTGMNKATLAKAALTTSVTSYTNAQLDGTPPVSSGEKAPWTLVMGVDGDDYTTHTNYNNTFVSDGTAAGTGLTSAPNSTYLTSSETFA
jgi:hypothetical protein